MKTSKFIAAAALSLLAAVGAQAETYQGVHAPVSANQRADVRAQAVVAARSENPYAEGVSSRVAARLVGSTDRGCAHKRCSPRAARTPMRKATARALLPYPRARVDRAAARQICPHAKARARHIDAALNVVTSRSNSTFSSYSHPIKAHSTSTSTHRNFKEPS